MESDAELIEQSLRGRPDAFVEVVGRHEVAVHGFLARRGGRQTADDLLSEVWVRAFGARAVYDTRYESARPWLYGIARNVLRIHWRAARGSGALVPAGEVDPWDDVVDRLDLTAAAEVLVGAVAALPRDERDVLLLVAWEQLSPGEAAVALGTPPGTARSRLHRARVALRSVLAAAPAGHLEEE